MAQQDFQDFKNDEFGMSAKPGLEWSAEYSKGWDDCLEAIHKVLGERFPRRVSLLRSADKASTQEAERPGERIIKANRDLVSK